MKSAFDGIGRRARVGPPYAITLARLGFEGSCRTAAVSRRVTGSGKGSQPAGVAVSVTYRGLAWDPICTEVLLLHRSMWLEHRGYKLGVCRRPYEATPGRWRRVAVCDLGAVTCVTLGRAILLEESHPNVSAADAPMRLPS